MRWPVRCLGRRLRGRLVVRSAELLPGVVRRWAELDRERGTMGGRGRGTVGLQRRVFGGVHGPVRLDVQLDVSRC